MSTRSRIGIIRRDLVRDGGLVESVYCHFDGYPCGVGSTLQDYWTEPALVDALIGLGDLSCLGSVIGRKHDFDTHTGAYIDSVYVEGKASLAGWCLAYGRDRGETGTCPVVHRPEEWPDSGDEYRYLYDPATREWTCSAYGNEWLPLHRAIARDASPVTS